MALNSYPIYGNTDSFYNILSGSGLFTTVTKSVVEGVKTITCADPLGTRFVTKVTNVNGEGAEQFGSQCGHTYYFGNNNHWNCGDFDGSYETAEARFPHIVYTTTSSMVVVMTTRNNLSATWPLKVLVLTKDNNGSVGVLTSNSYDDGLWNNDYPRAISREAPSPLLFSSDNVIARIGSAATLVPITTNDVSKVVFFPKVFRAVSTQFKDTQIGLSTLNNNEYLSLYGAVFVKID